MGVIDFTSNYNQVCSDAEGFEVEATVNKFAPDKRSRFCLLTKREGRGETAQLLRLVGLTVPDRDFVLRNFLRVDPWFVSTRSIKLNPFHSSLNDFKSSSYQTLTEYKTI